MRNSIKNTLAMLSAASMVFAGVAASAMSASAEGAVVLSLDKVTAEAGETVSYNLNVTNVTGWSGAGFVVTYDDALELVEGEDGIAATGEASSKALLESASKGAGSFSMAFASTKDMTKEGVIATVQFVVPEDAEAGTKYDITMVADQFGNNNGEDLDYKIENGYIEVKAAETTTTTEATTTTTTAATTTTTAAVTTTTAKVTNPPTGADNTTAALGLAGLLTAAAAAVVLKKKND